MSAETEELVRICDALPQEKRNEVADFARFLLARESDDAWERTLDDPRGHPKLDAFVKSALAEGSERAGRSSREKFDLVLSKVPEVEPEKRDRLSPPNAV